MDRNRAAWSEIIPSSPHPVSCWCFSRPCVPSRVENGMRLRRLEYREYIGTPREWQLKPFTLSDTNLIVGQNAVGKSRALNVIGGLGKLLKQTRLITEGSWEVE